MTPDRHTNQELMLEVGNGHSLYVHDWGNKDAKTPIFVLHGGPGSSCKDKLKMDFDPARQRVIFHDQRGCGRSTPSGSLEHNTTDELLGDINAIADKLGIERFVITGGSWGSCLALAYAIKHPKRLQAMVLRGIFTGSQAEIDWIDNGLFRTFYPEVWQQYLETTPVEHQSNPSAYHHQQALSADPATSKRSAYAYSNLEGAVLSFDDRYTPEPYDDFDPAGAIIEMHYLQNRCFLPDRYILDNATNVKVPVWLVQGRYDMVCPPAGAYALHNTLPESELFFTMDGHRAGHETWNLMRSILKQVTV